MFPLVSGRQVLGDTSLAAFYSADIVPNFRYVTAKVAASCAVLSGDVAGADKSRRCRLPAAASDWPAEKERLARLMQTSLQAYWSRIQDSSEAVRIPNVQRVRRIYSTVIILPRRH